LLLWLPEELPDVAGMTREIPVPDSGAALADQPADADRLRSYAVAAMAARPVRRRRRGGSAVSFSLRHLTRAGFRGLGRRRLNSRSVGEQVTHDARPDVLFLPCFPRGALAPKAGYVRACCCARSLRRFSPT